MFDSKLVVLFRASVLLPRIWMSSCSVLVSLEIHLRIDKEDVFGRNHKYLLLRGKWEEKGMHSHYGLEVKCL